jgi:hypothetical protein
VAPHLTVLHILLEYSSHDAERQTFHHHGELWDFLGDDLRIMVLLNGKEVNKYIYPTLF